MNECIQLEHLNLSTFSTGWLRTTAEGESHFLLHLQKEQNSNIAPLWSAIGLRWSRARGKIPFLFLDFKP